MMPDDVRKKKKEAMKGHWKVLSRGYVMSFKILYRTHGLFQCKPAEGGRAEAGRS